MTMSSGPRAPVATVLGLRHSVRSGSVAFRLIIMIETVSGFVAGIRFWLCPPRSKRHRFRQSPTSPHV
jgi:hypothetical protein